MSTDELRADATSVAGTAATLRRLFDAGFAAPMASAPGRVEDLLAIRVASAPYALCLSEIASLHVDVKIVPVPSPAMQLLGIVAVRGTMAPIYDLAALLRYPPAASPRWIVFARLPQRVGLAFETFESQVRVPQAALARGEEHDIGADATRPHLRGLVQAAGALRPIIHLASVVAILRGENS